MLSIRLHSFCSAAQCNSLLLEHRLSRSHYVVGGKIVMSPAIVAAILSRNTACREMCHLREGIVNGARRTVDASEWGFCWDNAPKEAKRHSGKEKPLSRNI